MRRITGLAMAALLAVAVSACGGDDASSSDDPTTTVGASGNDDGGTDDGGTDDTDIAAGLLDEDCRFLLAGAYLNPLAAAIPGAEDDFGASAEQLEKIAEEAPEEIQDAMATIADGYAAFADAIRDVDFEDVQSFTDPEVQAALQEASETFDEEYEEATETLNTYVSENCTGG